MTERKKSYCENTNCGNFDPKYGNHCSALLRPTGKALCPFFATRAAKERCLLAGINDPRCDASMKHVWIRWLERLHEFWAETPLNGDLDGM